MSTWKRAWEALSIATTVTILTACGGGAASTASSGSTGGTTSASTTSSSSGTGGTGRGGSGGSGGAVPYPAPHPAPPTVISGGKVMASPKVVSISFPNDPLEGDIDTFVTAMGNTTYWGDRTAEYGVGPVMPIARIHDPFMPPATFDNSDIQNWLVGQLDGTHPEYPAPDENTIYALYFPPGVSITMLGRASCTTFHGFHDNAQLADGTPVAYAVISRCDSIPEDPAAVGIQYVSAVASHEIIEGITDPFVETAGIGYFEPDQAHIVWAFVSLAELGDMCALIGNAFYTPTDFPYLVQRIWSNKTAPTGHDPCLPEPAGQVYFNSAPVLNDSVSFFYEGYAGTTKGVKIPVGATKTIPIQLFSEAETSGPWNVTVKEVGGTSLDLSLDKSSGKNGDELQLTIHVTSKNATYGAEVFVIESTLGTQKSLWVGMVGN
jgi:hypothetical protein